MKFKKSGAPIRPLAFAPQSPAERCTYFAYFCSLRSSTIEFFFSSLAAPPARRGLERLLFRVVSLGEISRRSRSYLAALRVYFVRRLYAVVVFPLISTSFSFKLNETLCFALWFVISRLSKKKKFWNENCTQRKLVESIPRNPKTSDLMKRKWQSPLEENH